MRDHNMLGDIFLIVGAAAATNTAGCLLLKLLNINSLFTTKE